MLQAWLRSRGSDSTTVYTSDTIAEQFGVVKSSYEAVPLPSRTVLAAVCKGAGKPRQQLDVVAQQLPPELEWGQVRVLGCWPCITGLHSCSFDEHDAGCPATHCTAQVLSVGYCFSI